MLDQLLSTVTTDLARRLAVGLQRTSATRQERNAQAAHQSARISAHLQEIASWSERAQVFGMSKPQDVGQDTVPLVLDSIPRRFRGQGPSEALHSELSLISGDRSVLLLGDPGAGKTTTVKRLARRILLSDSVSAGDSWQMPLVLRLREFEWTPAVGHGRNHLRGNLLAERVLEIFGAPTTSFASTSIDPDEREEDTAPRVDRERAEFHDRLILLAALLNEFRVLVFLDGLDEVQRDSRVNLERDIVELNRLLTSAKIVLSCRSGDHDRTIDGFDTLELCPLDAAQIRQIADRGATDSVPFMDALESSPIYELAARPLFLASILTVFNNSGSIPDQPAAIYSRTTDLVLRDWDERNAVRRVSRYSHFLPDRKRDFLASMSHALTCEIQTTRFTHRDLEDSYRSIAGNFGLPPDEALTVAREIESHTGLIVESGYDAFEFSHLTLQEYLCAHHLIRDPLATKASSYLARYPAPVAVAVSLSSNPSGYFAKLMSEHSSSASDRSLHVFLGRLLLERPSLSEGFELGLGVLYLLETWRDSTDAASGRASVLLSFLSMPVVSSSTRKALSMYAPIERDGRVKLARAQAGRVQEGGVRAKQWIEIDSNVWALMEQSLAG